MIGIFRYLECLMLFEAKQNKNQSELIPSRRTKSVWRRGNMILMVDNKKEEPSIIYYKSFGAGRDKMMMNRGGR